MAFINLIIPYAKKYYEKGLEIPDRVRNNFKDLCADNDTMGEFLDAIYEITGNDYDKIHKDEFMKEYNTYHNSKLPFPKVISDVKRLLRYSRTERVNNKKGVIIGIKLKEQELNNEKYIVV